MIPTYGPARRHIVLRHRQVDQLVVHVQEERRIDGAAVNRNAARGLLPNQWDAEDVDCSNTRPVRPERAQGFLVRVLPMGGNDNELLHSTLFPRSDQVVQESMERLAPNRCAAGKGSRSCRVHAIFYGGGAQDVEFCREVVREPLHDDGVTAQREVLSMLLRGTDGHDQPRIAFQVGAHRVGGKVFE